MENSNTTTTVNTTASTKLVGQTIEIKIAPNNDVKTKDVKPFVGFYNTRLVILHDLPLIDQEEVNTLSDGDVIDVHVVSERGKIINAVIFQQHLMQVSAELAHQAAERLKQQAGNTASTETEKKVAKVVSQQKVKTYLSPVLTNPNLPSTLVVEEDRKLNIGQLLKNCRVNFICGAIEDCLGRGEYLSNLTIYNGMDFESKGFPISNYSSISESKIKLGYYTLTFIIENEEGVEDNHIFEATEALMVALLRIAKGL